MCTRVENWEIVILPSTTLKLYGVVDDSYTLTPKITSFVHEDGQSFATSETGTIYLLGLMTKGTWLQVFKAKCPAQYDELVLEGVL